MRLAGYLNTSVDTLKSKFLKMGFTECEPSKFDGAHIMVRVGEKVVEGVRVHKSHKLVFINKPDRMVWTLDFENYKSKNPEMGVWFECYEVEKEA